MSTPAGGRSTRTRAAEQTGHRRLDRSRPALRLVCTGACRQRRREWARAPSSPWRGRRRDERRRPKDSAHLFDVDAGQYPCGLVHLGDQHPFPARCRSQQLRGVCRECLLHGRHGAVRGAHRGGCRRLGAARLVPARNRDPRRLDLLLLPALAVLRPVLVVGGGVGPARPGLHLLLRSGRGLARRCTALLWVRGRDGGGARAGPDGRRRRDARRLCCRRRDRAGHQSGRAVPDARGRAAGHVRGGLWAHARRRVHPRTLDPSAPGDPGCTRRLDRERLEESARTLRDAGRAVQLRRRDLCVLRPAAVPARALSGTPTRIPSRAWRRPSWPGRRCSAAGWRPASGALSAGAPPC